MPELVVLRNNQCLFRVPLDMQRLTMGRSSECDLVLNGEAVSRKHATIEKKGESFWLTDQSSSGTFVEGKRLTESLELQDGQKFLLADWAIEFHRESSAQKNEDVHRQTQITRLGQQQMNDATKVIQLQPSGKIKIFKPLLVVDDVGGDQRHYAVRSKNLVVGTAPECDVILKDRFVSKMHAEFTLSDQGFHVRDRESTNGTFLRGSKIHEAYVRDGEEIQVGKSKILVSFQSTGEEEVEPFLEDSFCGIYGTSRVMRLLFSRIQRVAAVDMTVLVHGETGSGKEMVAKAIHDLSSRKGKAYRVLNCGAIQPNLVESELFGHEKGAFTGADQRRIGAFEEANGGTLFLDEIGELPLEMQAKILRVLEYQTLRRVGGQQDIPLDVRVIAATHQDLASLVAHKKFREDLFYRLHVLTLEVPALRERKEDIDVLVPHFISLFSKEARVELQPEAIAKLKSHTWPGNVRELKNTILRALAFCQGTAIAAQDIDLLQVPLAQNSYSTLLDKTSPHMADVLNPTAKDQFERERVIKALQSARGDKDEAARILGVGRSTLFRKIKELGIE